MRDAQCLLPALKKIDHVTGRRPRHRGKRSLPFSHGKDCAQDVNRSLREDQNFPRKIAQAHNTPVGGQETGSQRSSQIGWMVSFATEPLIVVQNCELHKVIAWAKAGPQFHHAAAATGRCHE
jgi:hypothetical protein